MTFVTPAARVLKSLWQRSLLRRLLLLQIVACAGMLATLLAVFGSLIDSEERADTARTVEQLTYMLIDLEDPASSAPRLLTRMLQSQGNAASLEPLNTDWRRSHWLRFEMSDGSGAILTASALPAKSPPAGWSSFTLHDEHNGRTVQIAVDEAALHSVWRSDIRHLMTQVAIFTAVLIVPVLLLSSLVLARWGLAPLHQLSRTIARRSSDNLSALTMSRRYPELTPLLVELNRLLQKLRNSQQVERQFFADAAHELLTPVAALRAQAHLVVTAPDPAAQISAQQELDGGLQRMTALVRQLLLSARLDSERVQLDLQRQDLLKLARERISAMAARALNKGIDLSLETTQECPGTFDHYTLATAFDNILDNAIRYTPTRGRIVVKLRRRECSISVAIADDGPGIPVIHRGRVLERFFRVPGNQEAGSGLGLAIVARIVTLHGGIVRVRRGLAGRGTTVIMRLPTTGPEISAALASQEAQALPTSSGDLHESPAALPAASLKGV